MMPIVRISRRFGRVLCFFIVMPVFVGLYISEAEAKPGLANPELEEIRREISLLNLLRGLYLSKDQAQKLLALAEKAQGLRDGVRKEFEGDKRNIVQSFESLRDALFLEPGHEKEAQDKAKGIDGRIKESVGGLHDRIAEMEVEAASIFTSAQLSILQDFKPCLIPPKDLRNPVRVGQAAADAGIPGKTADLIYAAPDDVWNAKGKALLNKMLRRFEAEVGAMTPDMKVEVEKRLSGISERIRNCSDVDYHLKRESLADELLLINPKKALHQGHKRVGEIARWLLSETAVEILPKWLKTLEKPTNSSSADIAANEDFPEEASLTEMGAKVTKQIRKLYNDRKNIKGLPELESLMNPIMNAVEKGDRNEFLQAALEALDSMAAVKADQFLVKALARVVRQLARASGLPLLNPQHDPYGFAEELNSCLREGSDPILACNAMRQLIETIRRFKRMS